MNGTLSDIKLRLESVKQTRQMTNAMYLLSATKLKQAQRSMDYTLDYMDSLRRAMTDILALTEDPTLHNIYLEISPKGGALIMCVMGDKGFCGSYNQDVAALTLQKLKEYPSAKVCCFGKVGYGFLRRKGITPVEVFPGSSMHPEFSLAEDIARRLEAHYITDTYNEVFVIYTPYSGKGKLKPVCLRLLPLLSADFTDMEHGRIAPPECLPGAEEAFRHIVPQYCANVLYNILVQSSASENSARMESMQSAGDNADELIGDLQTQLNTVRQESITNEIAEISAAAAATAAAE